MSEDHITYTVTHRSYHRGYTPMIIVVGCGGTGGFLIEGLCRMLPENINILLVDHDRVEPHNRLRQNFRQDEIGEYKSKALALRMARNYQRPVGYRLYPFERRQQHSRSLLSNSYGIIIGCVDNSGARQSISEEVGDANTNWFWLDVGNAYNSGQVLFGNVVEDVSRSNQFAESFNPDKGVCYSLPAPSWQQPGLLIPTEEEAKPQDCAEAVDAGDQSPVINRFMAALALEFLRRFLEDKLQWMALYADLDAGTMRPVPIELKTVARITGVRKDSVIERKP